MISPQQYGALPSNERPPGYAQNNYEALRKCFLHHRYTGDNHRGDSIYIPSGSILINKNLLIERSTNLNNRSLFGVHSRQSVIMAAPGYSGRLIEFEDATYSRLYHVGFNGRDGDPNNLVVVRTWNFGMDNVNIRESSGNGLLIDKSQRIWIKDSEVEFNKLYGIMINDAAFVTIDNVSVKGNGLAGCYIVGKREHRIKFPNHKIRGLYCENCPVGLILENVQALQTVEGIHCPVGVSIEGRSIEHCILDARACQGDIVLDNKCRYNTIIMSYDNDKCELHNSGFYNKVEMVGGYPS